MPDRSNDPLRGTVSFAVVPLRDATGLFPEPLGHSLSHLPLLASTGQHYPTVTSRASVLL